MWHLYECSNQGISTELNLKRKWFAQLLTDLVKQMDVETSATKEIHYPIKQKSLLLWLFALCVEIKDAHTQQTINLNALTQMILSK